MFFSCKVCAEKDKRVQALESEIAFLRCLVNGPLDNKTIPDSVHEANGVIDGVDHQIEIQTYADSVIELSEAEIAEREAILGGTY